MRRRSRERTLRRKVRKPPECRREAGGDSGIRKSTPSSEISDIAAMTRKISRHWPNTRMKPPRSGATIGATPPTPCMMFMLRNSSGPPDMSISTARPRTIPKPPPIPCSTRSTSRTSTPGAKAQPTEASSHRTMPNSSGARRPIRSESGPATTWPHAVPRKNAVIVSCIREAVVESSSATSGNAGMYMSVASGPIALSVVSTTITIAVTLPRVPRSACSPGRWARSWSASSSRTGIAPVIVGIDPVTVGIPPVAVGIGPVVGLGSSCGASSARDTAGLPGGAGRGGHTSSRADPTGITPGSDRSSYVPTLRRRGRHAHGGGARRREPTLVGRIGALQPADHCGGHGDHRVLDDHLVQHPQDRVLDVLLESRDADRDGGDRAEDDRVHELAEPARGEQAGDQAPLPHPPLHAGDHEGVQALPCEEAREPREHHDPDRTERELEGLLLGRAVGV